MSDTSGLPVTPPDPAAPPADDQFVVHPAWEKAMEAVPDVIRGPIVNQIRETEREHQKALETARQSSIEPTWAEFVNQAKSGNVAPDELIDSYNNQQALRQLINDDPDAFEATLHDNIEQMVAAGQLTRKQGTQAHQSIQGDGGELLTPEQQEIADLKRALAENDARWAGVDEAIDSQAEAAEAEQYGQQFISDMNSDLITTFGENPSIPGEPNISPNAQLAVARIAASIMDSDDTETITNQQAIAEGIRQLQSIAQGFGGQAPAAAQGRQVLPVGAGTNGLPAPEPVQFDDEKARKQAMMDLMNQMQAES